MVTVGVADASGARPGAADHDGDGDDCSGEAMKLFGTDGIRGKAGEAPLDEETVTRVGAALVRGRASAGHSMRVLVGRDTRESGDWIERALARGLVGKAPK